MMRAFTRNVLLLRRLPSELNLSKVFEPKPAKAGQEVVEVIARRKFVGVK